MYIAVFFFSFLYLYIYAIIIDNIVSSIFNTFLNTLISYYQFQFGFIRSFFFCGLVATEQDLIVYSLFSNIYSICLLALPLQQKITFVEFLHRFTKIYSYYQFIIVIISRFNLLLIP